MSIHILHTSMHEHSRKPIGDLWCFSCRKRLPHDWVVMVCDDPMSYYDPHGYRECSRCHHDRTLFPGTCYA